MQKKCLVVDDVIVSRYVSRSILEALDLEVMEAETSEAGFSLAQNTEFDVIFIDWHLRRESGLDLIQKIRKLPGYSTTPIITCTGVENEDGSGEAIKAGASGYILKPTTREKFIEELKKLGVI